MEKNNSNTEKFLKVSEVARIVNISPAHVYRLIDKKKLPIIDFDGAFRIRKSDLDEFIRQNFKPCV